jgi:TonB family protein
MSEMGTLSGCILENDPETLGRARRVRGKALIASVGLEAALISAGLMWPLLSPGLLGGRLIVTPLPPFSGGGGEIERRPRSLHPVTGKNEAPRVCLLCSQEAAAPVHPSNSGEGRETAAGGAPDIGLGPAGDLSGPVIPGGDGNNRLPIEIKKPEAPQHLAPRPMSEGVMAAALSYKVQPVYPWMARNIHVSGTVRLRAIIATDGRIRELEVINGNAFLQAAAVAAVRQWRYRPTLLNGVAVEVETFITVNFVLDQP